MPGPIDYSGDDYPREGCIVTIDVLRDGYVLRIASPKGVPLEGYAKVKTARAIGRMVEEWCAGFAPRIHGRLD